MRNPFLLRASEAVSDEEFAVYFAPGVLDLLPTGAEQWRNPLFIQSAPGGGKTSLFRLFTPGVLRRVIGLRQTERPELYSKLRELKVIADDAIAVLGIGLACRSSFARVERLSASEATKEAAFIALVNARVVLATLRAAATFAQLRYPADLSKLTLTSASNHSALLELPQSGDGLFTWASAIESALFEAFDSFNVRESALPTHGEMFSFEWLSNLEIISPDVEFPRNRLLMVDDAHDLHRSQRRLLFDEAVKSRAGVGIWLAERLQSLDADQILSLGALTGRDFSRYIRIERAWSQSQKAFEKFVSGIGDRRIAMADDVRHRSIGQLLSSRIEPTMAEKQRLNEVIERYRAPFTTGARKAAFYEPLIKVITADSATEPLELAIRWCTLNIIAERDQRRVQRTFEFIDTTQREAEEVSNSAIRGAAELFVAAECRLPFYFGFHRLAEESSWNVDQFLRLAGDYFEEIAAAAIVGEPQELTPQKQEQRLLKLADAAFAEIELRVPLGAEVQRLIDGIGRLASSITRQPNAPYAPGVTGIGLSVQDKARLVTALPKVSERDSKLAFALANCLANNLLEARDEIRSKGQQWYVLYLNRLLCVKYRLPLAYGGWRPVKLDLLERWMGSGYREERKLVDIQAE